MASCVCDLRIHFGSSVTRKARVEFLLVATVVTMVARPKKAPSRSHLSPYIRGVIYGLIIAGWTYQEIADEVEKPDGENLCQQTVATVASQAKARGGMHWDGQ